MAVSSSTMAANGLPSVLANVPSLNARPFMVLHLFSDGEAYTGNPGRVPVGRPGKSAAALFRERILPLGLAPVFHRLAEHLDEHEYAAAALLQRAADGFDQVDDSWEHGIVLLFLGGGGERPPAGTSWPASVSAI